MEKRDSRELLKTLTKNWDTIGFLVLATSVLILVRLGVIPDNIVPAATLGILCAFFVHLIVDRNQEKKAEENIVQKLSEYSSDVIKRLTEQTGELTHYLSEHSAEVKATISASLSNEFRTHDEDLSPFREPLHHYHVTVINGIPCWRYALVDFSQTNIDGFLSARVSFLNKEENPVWYNVNAGLRTDRLVLFFTPERGTEPAWIEIYPYANEGYSDTLPGFAFLKNWDKKQQLGQCLMTRSAVHRDNNLDHRGVLQQEAAINIDKNWKSETLEENLMIFPGTDKWGLRCEKITRNQSNA